MEHTSIATIDSPEFINVSSISPLISACEIKVCYLGENRNKSVISKEVAKRIAATLPGTPIVGYYTEKKEDFEGHGEQVVIHDTGEIEFKVSTMPYGFVPTDTKIWFKDFQELDEKGNVVVRKYLMCQGYLWTERYEQAKKALEEGGRPQSMELDEETLKGFWSTDYNRGIDFFIINDAIMKGLCILGDSVEPCFEGASITNPDISANFSYNSENFMRDLSIMAREIKNSYNLILDKQGGQRMENNENIQEKATEIFNSEEKFSAKLDNNEQEREIKNQNSMTEFKKAEGEDPKDTEKSSKEEKTEEKKESSKEEKVEEKKESSKEEVEPVKKEDKKEESTEKDEKKEPTEEDKKKVSKNSLNDVSTLYESMVQKYAALEIRFNELNEKYTNLVEENKILVDFKLKTEEKEKDALINKFYMLSEEDKKDVIENKAKYSLDDIESKLSVICVRKKVNFDDEPSSRGENPITTFNLNSCQSDDLPAWLKAVEDQKNS